MKLLEKNVDAFVKEISNRAGRLVGKVAIHGGVRRPIAWSVDAFFLGIVDALEAENIPRNVAADMFGVSKRTLQRRLDSARHTSGQTHSDWIRISDYIRENGAKSREELLIEFPAIAPHTMASLVRDLVTAGAFVETKNRVSYAGTDRSLSELQLDELVVRMHQYLEMEAPDIAAIADLNIERVNEVLARPVAERWDVDENTVWILMPEALRRAFDFFEGRVAGKAGNHKGIVLNLRSDDLPTDAQHALREVVQKCVKQLQKTVDRYGDVNETYPDHGVEEWSVVLLENFGTQPERPAGSS